MNRRELAIELAKRLGISKRLAERLVKAFFQEIIEALRRGERVEMRNFGAFEVHNRRAFLGFHPKTGRKIQISPSKSIRFRPSKRIKQIIQDCGPEKEF